MSAAARECIKVITTRSLTRPDTPQGAGPDCPFLKPRPVAVRQADAPQGASRWSPPDSERARDYLAAKARWPGVRGNRIEMIEAEMKSMSTAERVFLEIEMTEHAAATHSADYDPLVWGRS